MIRNAAINIAIIAMVLSSASDDSALPLVMGARFATFRLTSSASGKMKIPPKNKVANAVGISVRYSTAAVTTQTNPDTKTPTPPPT